MAGVSLLLGVLACSESGSGEVQAADSLFIELEPDHPAYAHRNLIRKVAGGVGESDPVGAELLILQDGKPLFHGSWGVRDRELTIPWTKNTIVRMRALSQPILATAVLILMERGKFGLEDPLSVHLPEFDSNRWGAFSIEELLAGVVGPEPLRDPRPFETYPSLSKGLMEMAARGPADSEVSESADLDVNYSILAGLVERHCGMPVDDFLREEIFKPLGMNDTYCVLDSNSDWRDRLAASYSRAPSGLGFRRDTDNTRNSLPRYFNPATGVFSTAADYARFAQTWMGSSTGTTLLQAATIQRAHKVAKGTVEKPRARSYAWTLYDKRKLGSTIPAPFGLLGGGESVILASPEERLIIIYLTQCRGGRSVTKFTNEVSGDLQSKQSIVAPKTVEAAAKNRPRTKRPKPKSRKTSRPKARQSRDARKEPPM